MSKIPEIEFNPDLVNVTTNIAKAMKELGATAEAGKPWMVPRKNLFIMDGLNVRVTDTPAYRQRLDSYKMSIRQNGFMPNKPLTAILLAGVDGAAPTLFITDGHTRFEAVAELAAEKVKGLDLLPVILLPPSTTMDEIMAGLGQGNEATPLSMFEKAILSKRYESMGNTKAQIAEKMGLSTKQIDNLLTLAGAPTKLRNQVITGKISGSDAVKLIREHGGDASAVAEQAVTVAAEKGKAKASRKHVKATEKGKAKEAAKSAKKTPKTEPTAPVAEAAGVAKKPSKWKNGTTEKVVFQDPSRTVIAVTGNYKAGEILKAADTVVARRLAAHKWWAFVDEATKEDVIVEESVVITAEITVFTVPPKAEAPADDTLDGL